MKLKTIHTQYKNKPLPIIHKKNLTILMAVTITFCLLSAFFVQTPLVYCAESNYKPQMAIIIDDFGGNFKGVRQFLEGDIPITVAIMPFLEESTEQAEKAHELGFEVIIHLPMQPKNGKPHWLGPNAITQDLSVDEVKQRLEEAIDDVPHAVGINNHMGSLIVEDEEKMRVIMGVLKEKDLYIVDSGTSPKSLIPKLAEQYDVPWTVNNLFLDSMQTNSSEVARRMKKLHQIAQRNGQAIGIGHVGLNGEATYKGIAAFVEQMKEDDVSIVPVSDVIHNPIKKPWRFP